MIKKLKIILGFETHQEWVKRNKAKLDKWSEEVRDRDGNRCVACGYKPKKINGEWESDNRLNAHHIIPKNLSHKKAFDIDNGATLCDNCHTVGKKAYHRIYGYKRGNKRIFNRWLRHVRGENSTYLVDIILGVEVILITLIVFLILF